MATRMFVSYDVTMSQLLSDMLKNRNYDEPPEVKIIKDFIKSEFGFTVNVSVKANSFVVNVPSASAAGALRSKVFQLQKMIKDEKRIVIRIG